MILQKSPNPWSCLPTAFAMAVGINVEQLINSVGHDGGDIIWPNLPEPERRRGFHTQEIIRVLRTGFSITPIERMSRLAPRLDVTPRVIDNENLFDHVVKTTRGVLTGHTKTCGHAVAYDHGVICDPIGRPYKYANCKDFVPNCAWIILVKSNPECNTTMP
jgi:hypothetical protein